MKQGKIESFHRSMKNVVKLNNYYLPEELIVELEKFVEYYDYHRYHESINNVTPADAFIGRKDEILNKRIETKKRTLRQRKKRN